MTTTAPVPGSVGHERPARRRDLPLGLAGVGFAALLLPVVLVPHASLDYEPTKPPAGSVITGFFRQHYALEQGQALAHSLAAVVLLVFFATLAGFVRRTGDVRAARLTLAAGAAMSTVMLVTMALVAGSISMTGAVDGRVQGWLYNIGWSEHPRFAYLLPVALIPACAALRRARVLPGALTWTGQLLGVLGPVAMLGVLSSSTEFLEYPVFLLLILWVLATGVVALTRGLKAVQPQDQPLS